MLKKISLVHIWYGIIVAILVALLYENVVKIELGSAAFWLRLVFLLIALVLTFYIVGDIFRPEMAARRVEKIYSRELRRKSEEIKRLKMEKELFASSALKQASKNVEQGKK